MFEPMGLNDRKGLRMASSPISTPESSSYSPTTECHDTTATVGIVGTALTGMAALPQAFEQYPYGTAIVVGLVAFRSICWVAVTWITHRRG
jgi:hypothetical protein